eukprot:COSAG01_NODE_2477_length_7615_cov_7.259609_7_plen_71_part_00
MVAVRQVSRGGKRRIVKSAASCFNCTEDTSVQPYGSQHSQSVTDPLLSERYTSRCHITHYSGGGGGRINI